MALTNLQKLEFALKWIGDADEFQKNARRLVSEVVRDMKNTPSFNLQDKVISDIERGILHTKSGKILDDELSDDEFRNILEEQEAKELPEPVPLSQGGIKPSSISDCGKNIEEVVDIDKDMLDIHIDNLRKFGRTSLCQSNGKVVKMIVKQRAW